MPKGQWSYSNFIYKQIHKKSLKHKEKVNKLRRLYTELSEPLKRSVPEICADIGISRTSFYDWKKRLDEYYPQTIIPNEPGKTIFIPMKLDSKEPVDLSLIHI